MKLTLDSLMVLDAIDRRGSFAAAAEELYRVPSAITYSVQKLEQDLNVQWTEIQMEIMVRDLLLIQMKRKMHGGWLILADCMK